MNLKGMVVINLTQLDLGYMDDVATVRGALFRPLLDSPDGADLRLIVPPWDWWCGLVVAELADQSAHLGCLTIESTDPATVGKWMQALHKEMRVAA